MSSFPSFRVAAPSLLLLAALASTSAVGCKKSEASAKKDSTPATAKPVVSEGKWTSSSVAEVPLVWTVQVWA